MMKIVAVCTALAFAGSVAHAQQQDISEPNVTPLPRVTAPSVGVQRIPAPPAAAPAVDPRQDPADRTGPVAPAAPRVEALPPVVLPPVVVSPPAAQPPVVVPLREVGNLECRDVRIVRPNISVDRPIISVRFISPTRQNLVEAIVTCNADRPNVIAIERQTQGVRVRFMTFAGAGTIGLPSALFVDGAADQVVCASEPSRSNPHRKYAKQWSGGMPAAISLDELSSFDRAAADRMCAALPQ